jgi:hypothetical protein
MATHGWIGLGKKKTRTSMHENAPPCPNLILRPKQSGQAGQHQQECAVDPSPKLMQPKKREQARKKKKHEKTEGWKMEKLQG